MSTTVATSALERGSTPSHSWLSRHRPPARAAAAVVVAVAVLAGLVGPAGAGAQPPPAPCDADGDGRATGVAEVVHSDGADEAAARLRAEAGHALEPARPAWRWRVPVCAEPAAGGGRALAVTGAPVAELDPAAPGWEAAARDRALERLRPQLYRPGPRTSPPVNGVQYVGVEMWLAVDPAAWVPFTETATDGEVDVTATATPGRVVWEFSDGVSRVCDGPGTQYSPGAAGPAPCGRDFEATTDVVPVTLSVSIDYLVTWSSTIGGGGRVGLRGEAHRYELVVGEVQTYLTDGSRPAPAAPAAPPPPRSTRPVDDERCRWSSFWDCSPADLAGAVTDLAGDVALAALPAPVRQALEQVWAFVSGCAAFVGDLVGSAREVFSQMAGLVTDPAGFVRDKLDLARALYDAARADPGGFAAEVAGEVVEADLLAADPARWGGRIGCEIALAVLTAGAASKRFADLPALAERLRDWSRRRDAERDRDGEGACRASSFPTGTPVLMADGSRRPIDAVRPGEAVWAFDPDRGAWSARAVERQWSYLDTDEMATVALVGGGAVSATDHHRFYSATRAGFAPAEDLRPGEALVTPAGEVVVAAVARWPSGPTLVWELTVAVDHTFAVLAGDHAVAVHNADHCTPGQTGDVPLGFRDRAAFEAFSRELNDGLRAAGFDDATAAFQGSSVTGRSFVTEAPFDEGRTSDFDIAIASPKAMAEARSIGVPLRSGGRRTAPLADDDLHQLRLLNLSETLSRTTGRPVFFMLYQSIDDAVARSPSVLVPPSS